MCERKKEILPSLPFPVDKGGEWMRGVESIEIDTLE
jgi:hypothetical protein